MLQRVQLEHVAVRFSDQIVELRRFFTATSIPVETAASLPAMVAKLKDDRAFRRDLHSHLWAILHDSAQPIHSADLLGIVAIAIAGVEFATTAENDHAHDLLRFTMEMRTSVGPTNADPVEKIAGRGSPATWVHVASSGQTGPLFRTVAACVILLLALLLLRKRAPYDWQVTPAASMDSRTMVVERTNPTLPGNSALRPSTSEADEARYHGPAVSQAPSHAWQGHQGALALKPRATRLLANSNEADTYVGSPDLRQAPAGAFLPNSVLAATAAPEPASSAMKAAPVIRMAGGPIPTSVLSQRIGARSLPYVSAAQESLYYPTVPKLLRRAPKSEDSTLLAANEPLLSPDAKRDAVASAVGSVRPVLLGTMAANILFSPTPVYPAAAAAAHVQGEVTLRAEVDRAGNVAAVRVISGPPLLRDAAVDAVQRWHYKPYLQAGKPVSMSATAVMDFQLP